MVAHMFHFLIGTGGGERSKRPAFRPVLGPPVIERGLVPSPRRPLSEGVGPAVGDERGFIHRKGSFFRRIAGKVAGSVPVVGGIAQELIGAIPGAGGQAGCPPGFFRIGAGDCRPLSGIFGRPRPSTQFERPTPAPFVPIAETTGFPGGAVQGDPVMGRFGAGFEPDLFATTTRRCGRGAVLGLDGICYNRRDLRNSERFWPRGRRPLLTGGEMRCISVASSAAKKLQKKQKQLTELGLLKPRTTRARAAAPVHVRTAGVVHN